MGEAMNAIETREAKLSTDINVITAEINAYKQVAGEAIFEIGRRLKHVKENDLAHGEWERWLRNDAKISPSQARMFIKVSDEFGENRCTFNELGLRALYEIATLPESERDKPHTVPSTGETKTPDEMTVRELREVKRKLKAEQEARKRAEREAQEKENEVERLKERPEPEPEVRTEYIEVEDEEMRGRLQKYEERFGDIENYSDRHTATNLQEITTSVMSFSKSVRDLTKRHAYLIQYQHVIGSLDSLTLEEYNQAVQALNELTVDFKKAEQNGVIIDAEYKSI